MRAEATLVAGDADLVAFGRPALANPDLPVCLAGSLPLNAPDFATLHTGRTGLHRLSGDFPRRGSVGLVCVFPASRR